MEVMRDKNDNVVIICSIENIDAMGVHTGDSHHRRADPDADRQGIPADARRQRSPSSAPSASRRAAATSSSRIDPDNGDMVVVEMNPRVSRSSALASKATGYPIAKIAAKLAVGYTLDELPNYITSEARARTARLGAVHLRLLRADDRLLRDQDPALDVREIPRRRRDADHADEERRRSDGDRPDVQGSPAKGHPQHGGQALRLRAGQVRQVAECRNVARASRPCLQPTASTGKQPVPRRRRRQNHARRIARPRMADPRRQAPPQARRAEPGAAVLHPLCAEDGLDDRADSRADEHRSVVPGADEGVGGFRRRSLQLRADRDDRDRSRSAIRREYRRAACDRRSNGATATCSLAASGI